MDKIGVIGAAGVGRRCIDIIQAIGVDVVGVFDDSVSTTDKTRLQERGIPFLGTTEVLQESYPGLPIVIGIGAPKIRSSLVGSSTKAGQRLYPTLIDPGANLGSKITLERGVVICSGVEVSTNTTVGSFTHINPGAIIGHDVKIGNSVSVNPGAIISGDVIVEDSCLIGAGAIILQGLTIGEGATVGAGSVVTKDVYPYSTVMGSPAKKKVSSMAYL